MSYEYVMYKCPTCNRRVVIKGSEPDKCIACGRVICPRCSPTSYCLKCLQYLTPGEVATLKDINTSHSKVRRILVSGILGNCCFGMCFLITVLWIMIGKFDPFLIASSFIFFACVICLIATIPKFRNVHSKLKVLTPKLRKK